MRLQRDMGAMTGAGFSVFEYDVRVATWAKAASRAAKDLDLAPDRCGGTWHVGVDALPNLADGSIAGVPLAGPWPAAAPFWHPAQLSVVYPGFPRQDDSESDAAYRYRRERFGAHIDGLLPIGPERKRYLKEPHTFILGIALNSVRESPLMVWPGSHLKMREAFSKAFSGVPVEEWDSLDVTGIYQAARKEVLQTIAPQPVEMAVGQAVLLDRHMLHGVRPWDGNAKVPRMVAYFRPQFSNIGEWV